MSIVLDVDSHALHHHNCNVAINTLRCLLSSHSFIHTTRSLSNYAEGRVKCHYKFVVVHNIPALTGTIILLPINISIMAIYSFIVSSIMPVSVFTGLLHSTGCGLSVADHITSGTSHYCNGVCSGEKDKTFFS